MANPILLRSDEDASGYDHICDSQKGGGQGNALTGQTYVILENDSLKEVESQFPGVVVKAIHDDIAMGGLASDIFGPNGHGGALESLIPYHQTQGKLRPHYQPHEMCGRRCDVHCL